MQLDAPFILISRLRPAMAASPARRTYVVNVSAMEGQFSRGYKGPGHPHTNMAKAALNMLTRTSAQEMFTDGILMTAVDTGWITDERPHPTKIRLAEEGFHAPLDLVDGAARVYDPIVRGEQGEDLYGCFLKDYSRPPGRPTRTTRRLFAMRDPPHPPRRRGPANAEGTLAGTYQIRYVCPMDAVFQALADQSRRTVLEILRDHPATAGELADALPIARPGVSRHLRVLREAGLVDVRQEAQRRIYSLRPEALVEVDEWLEDYRALWQNRLDALHTEIARGKKAQK